MFFHPPMNDNMLHLYFYIERGYVLYISNISFWANELVKIQITLCPVICAYCLWLHKWKISRFKHWMIEMMTHGLFWRVDIFACL